MDIRLRPRCTIIAPPTTRPILITLLVHPLLGFTRHPLLYHVSTSSYRLQDRCAGLPSSARSCATVLVGLLPARRGHEPSSSPVVIVITSGCQTNKTQYCRRPCLPSDRQSLLEHSSRFCHLCSISRCLPGHASNHTCLNGHSWQTVTDTYL